MGDFGPTGYHAALLGRRRNKEGNIRNHVLLPERAVHLYFRKSASVIGGSYKANVVYVCISSLGVLR
jgi:hypothetical protein